MNPTDRLSRIELDAESAGFHPEWKKRYETSRQRLGVLEAADEERLRVLEAADEESPRRRWRDKAPRSPADGIFKRLLPWNH